MQPLWAREDLGAMAMKRYSAFPKTSALQEPINQIVQCHIQDPHFFGGGGSYSSAEKQPDWETGQKDEYSLKNKIIYMIQANESTE